MYLANDELTFVFDDLLNSRQSHEEKPEVFCCYIKAVFELQIITFI